MNQKREFGFRDKIGYMFGDFGNDFTFIFSSMMLMKFYSDVMGVDTGIIGTMMMASRLVDAFTDVTMGQIVDRSKVRKKGKFLPWILFFSGPVALSSFLMYASWFRDYSMGFKIAYMFVTYFLWGSVFYTAINIPYGSAASAISDKPKDRAVLSNYRSIGAALASMVIGVVLPLLVYYKDENGNEILSGKRVSIAAFVCSILAVICYLICYNLVTERVKSEGQFEKFNLKKVIKKLITNRPLIGLVVSTVFMILVQLTLSQMTSYIFPNYFKNTTAQSAAGLVGAVITFLCATFTVPLSEKFGRKTLSIFASISGAIVFIIAFFVHTENPWIFVGFFSVAYIGLAVFSLICWAMITDVIDDSEVRIGKRDDGTIYAVYSFSRKLGQALSSGITGYLLTFIGYSAETAFEPKVTEAIYNITCLVPAVGYLLLALILWLFYPLNKKRVEENARILHKKREEQD